MGNYVANITAIFKDLSSPGIKKLQGNFSGMKSSLADINNGSGMMRMAADISMVAGMTEPFRQKLSAALDAPSRSAAGFEDSMAAVNTVISKSNSLGGDLQKTYGSLKKASIEWSTGAAKGAKYATASAKEFAGVSYDMLSAGLDSTQAIAATQKALLLAKGTMGDNRQAASLLATVYNNMGNKTADVGDEFTRLSDIVAKTQATFQISNLGQLSEGLKYGIPVAQKYGVSLEQLSTVIGQLNSAGLQGSMAGTSFSSMMAQMNKASGQLGFKVAYDPSGGMDVIGTLANIQAKYGDISKLSPKMQMAFDQAFGQEGGRSVVLLSSSLKQLQGNFSEVSNSMGTSEEMAKRMSNTYSNSIARLNNVTEAYKIKTGEATNKIKGAFAGVSATILEAFSPVLDSKIGTGLSYIVSGAGLAGHSLLSMGGAALNTTAQLATVMAMAEKAGGFGKLFSNSFGMVKNASSLLMTPLKGLGKGFISLGKGIITALPSMFAWIASVWSAAIAHLAAFWPIYAIIAAVAAIGVAVFLVIKHWDKLKAFFVKLWGGIKAGFVKFKNWISNILDNKWIQGILVIFFPLIGIPIAIIKNWDKIKAFFAKLWGGVKATFAKFKDFVGGLFSNKWILGLMAVFMPFIGIPLLLKKHWGSFKQFFASIADWFKGVFDTLIAPFKKLGAIFKGLFSKKDGKKVSETMASGIEADNSLYDATAKNFGKVDTLIPHSDAKAGPFSRLTTAGKAIVSTMASGANSDFSLSDALNNVFESTTERVKARIQQRKENNSKGGTQITIQNLQVNAEDMRSILDFIHLLQDAAGVTL